MDDNEKPQIVAPEPINDQAMAGVRLVLLVLGVATSLAGIIARRDMAAFQAYIQTNEFITVLGFLVTSGVVWWGQMVTRHRAKQLKNIAEDVRVPDAVIVTKEAAK